MSEGKINRLRRGATLEVFSSTSQRKRLAEVKQHVYTPTDVHFGHIDSAFQSQEYIAQLIRQDPHDVQRIVTPPKQLDDDKGSVDDGCWLYEQLRRLAQDLSYPLITNLQLECNRESCPEMKAGEWLYLCVAHGNATGGHVQCCAIDYIVHTLDSATALLNSTRVFPSRLSVPQSSYRHFSSLARRLSRIFAHAFYHHRELFSQAEAESSLYARFLALSRQHELVPTELLVIPSDGFDTNASNHSNHEPEDRRDPGSPQSAIEASDEGTFLPSQSEKDAARRLFEEWTANKGQEPTEEDEEAEGPEEEVGEINGDSRDVTEQESSIPAAQEDQVKPKEDEDHPPVPEEPHAEKEPQVEAAPEPEPEHKSGPEPAPESEEKKDESESSPSLEKPANGEDRAPSPIKEVNSSHEDKDETKEKGQDQAKGESNPEQPKDTA